MNLEIGSTVGDYQIVGVLGAGGMGKVYKVRNLISDRIEAMKVLLPDLVTEPELADRFLREIKTQASLEHPSIASLHTAVRVDNQLLMLMEFVEGQTLEQRLQGGPLPVEQAVDYISQVLSALDYAHRQGVIHRDIKPANMMLTPAGTVKLMDFGIAKASTDQRLTMTGTTMGSLYYMSPEQIKGAAHIDARADLYSVGVSLYELVTGKRPFDGDSQFAIMSAHLEKMPVPPVEVDPRLPQALNDAILMAVAKDPAMRFQTAGAFRMALSSILPSKQAAPAPAPVLQTGPRPASPVITQPVAPAQPMPALQPMMPAAIASEKPKGKRGLWMALGALAAVLGAIAVLEFAPSKDTKAQTQNQAQPSTVMPAQTRQRSPRPRFSLRREPPASQAAASAQPPQAIPFAAPKTGGTTRHATAQSPMVAASTPQAQPSQPAAQLPTPQPIQQQPVQQPPAQAAQPAPRGRRTQPRGIAGDARDLRTVGCACGRHPSEP